MYACVGGHVETVKEFLNNGANIDDYNEKGHTSLMKAAGAGHVMVAKVQFFSIYFIPNYLFNMIIPVL